ncbi:unnamed protein product [Fusarium graminearum]|uniref:Uncharacterized protein n=1 Tax=Gibberella zeae TaxID=5518 RepID=A0A9N8RML1_GIBZA|nr:unnamed protein product [Fusarium graminearum]CAG2004961.1 unnamed protein product [Fusarium graminearum]
MWTGREITTATSYASQERYPGAVFPCHQQVGEKSNKATVRSTLPGKRHLRGRVIIEYAVNLKRDAGNEFRFFSDVTVAELHLHCISKKGKEFRRRQLLN